MSFAFASTLGEVVARAWGRALRLAPPIAPSQWAAEHLIVPDGPRKLEAWDPELTPYIREPLDMCALTSPVNEIDVMKSAQTGFTTLLLAAVGHTIDREPSDTLLVQPTDGALTDFNGLKLGPMIEATEALAAKVKPQTSRSGAGSTTYAKKFGAYTLTLAIATSTSDLRSKTKQKVFLDEVDEYPNDVNGQGDPVDMATARQESFLESGEWKRVKISTPTIKNGSRIEASHARGDQRKWHVPCPGCGTEFVFEHGPRFRFNRAYPYEAHYLAPCCDRIIGAHEKNALVRKGRWIATEPGPGRHPSYHFGGMSSPFVPWDVIAKRFVEAGDDSAKLKTFFNLTLGLPYEEELSEVTAQELVAATEDYPRGIVPIRAGRTVLAVDFNSTWAEWALYAFGPSVAGDGVDQWLVEHGTCPGRPGDAELGLALEALFEREWPYAGGGAYRADRVGLDTGFGTYEIYKLARGKPDVRALDGRPPKAGDVRKALPLGTPTKAAAKDAYGRIKFRVDLYPVGSHDLKLWLAGALSAFAQRQPRGSAIHLPREIVDLGMADQLLGEVLVARERRDGRTEDVWVPRRGIRNEGLDLAVYARALALGVPRGGLGLENVTRAQWGALLMERHQLAQAQADLFTAPETPPPSNPSSPARGGLTPASVPTPAPAPASPARPARAKTSALGAALRRAMSQTR
ncbi:terminase gpA endonuclease subunit [Xanthobacter tagetidis]|uniref:Terminase n=1 Tax=Xanthobacter tagetidis TaxID=60216 RepID=A0A3L7ALY9_9HYPH|nr:terminase gpA endonuclease subunit [Xanthobacter tagetidis]MBB6308920.1 phage terminase large subunit GpA-like protein [Xanthobacter tagetidis]RLP80568.1 terminase [Xanthobacter tagetidis]